MAATNAVQIAQARRNEMLALFQANDGTLTPREVLEFARSNPQSALASSFTWSNDEAAEQWRLEEARRLITRNFVVIPVPGSAEERRVRMTISLPADRGTKGYRLMTDTLNDPASRDAMVRVALRELNAFRRKYEVLSELAEVFAAIETANHTTAA